VKKYIVGLAILFVMYNAQAMESTELSSEDHQACFLIARHLCLNPSIKMTPEHLKKFGAKQQNIRDQVALYQNSYADTAAAADSFQNKFLDMKIKDAYNSFYELDTCIKYELGWRYKETALVMFLNGGSEIIYSDMVNDVLSLKLRSSEIMIPEVIVEEVNLFDEVMSRCYAQFNGALDNKDKKIDVKQKESLKNITKMLKANKSIAGSDLTVKQLFNLCGGKNEDWCLHFKVRDDESCQSQDEKPFWFIDFSLGVNEKRVKIVCGLDFILKMASVHGSRDLIKKICAGSTAGKDGDVMLRHQVTQEDRVKLLDLHKKANNCKEWKVLLDAAIGIKFQEAWLKDTALLAIPLGVVDGVIPSLVARYTHGLIPTIFGSGVSGVMGYCIGNAVFPALDAYSSGANVMRENFGENGVRRIKWGAAFAWYSAMHYIMIKIADRLLQSSHVMLYRAGLTIHAIRLGAYLFGLFHKNMIDDPDKPISGIKDFIAYYFGSMRFNNPVLRRTKKDIAPTLGDLVNAAGC